MTTSVDRAGRADCCDDPQDAAWGRLPGAEPPLPTWVPAAVAAVVALVLTLVIVLLDVVRVPGTHALPLERPAEVPGRSCSTEPGATPGSKAL